MAHVGQIWGHFLVTNMAKLGQYIGFCLISWKVSDGFALNLIYKLTGANFVDV